MVTWIQIVKALVVLAVLASVVVWIHFASLRQADKDAEAPKRRS